MNGGPRQPEAVCLAVALAFAAAAVGIAPAASASESDTPTFGGSVRTLTGAVIERSWDVRPRVQGLTENQLRLTAEGPLGTDSLQLQLHGVQYISFGTAFGPLRANAPQRYRVFRDDEAWLHSQEALAFAYLDRANLKLSAGVWDFTVGRQVISFAKSYFWSALDVYRPFSPWVFDRDYKPGVDAVRISTAFGQSTGLELIGAFGRTLFVDPTTGNISQRDGSADVSYYGSSALLRSYSTLGDVDLSLQVGRVYGGYQGGVGFAATWLGLGVHAEAAGVMARVPLEAEYADAPLTGALNRDLVTTHATAVVGVDRSFESGFSFVAEYCYNGGGSRDFASGARRIAAGEVVNINEHLAGLMLRYELTPLIQLSGTAIVAPRDPSALLSPALSYSISENADLLVGAIFATGKRPYAAPTGLPRSEFGAYKHIAYVQWKAYF